MAYEHTICAADECDMVLRPDGRTVHYDPDTQEVIAETDAQGRYTRRSS